MAVSRLQGELSYGEYRIIRKRGTQEKVWLMMKLKVKRYSDIGARRPSSGNFAEEVVIDADVGEYSTIELFGIFLAFRSFDILSIDEKGITISALSKTDRGEKKHEPQHLRIGGIIGFEASQYETSDDGPGWYATDEIYFETVE